MCCQERKPSSHIKHKDITEKTPKQQRQKKPRAAWEKHNLFTKVHYISTVKIIMTVATITRMLIPDSYCCTLPSATWQVLYKFFILCHLFWKLSFKSITSFQTLFLQYYQNVFYLSFIYFSFCWHYMQVRQTGRILFIYWVSIFGRLTQKIAFDHPLV